MAFPIKHMSQKLSYTAEVMQIAAKYGAWIGYVAIGIIGKFGLDVLNHRKISAWYIFGTGCTSLFVGWIASRWCMVNHPDYGAYMVPVATLLSRDVLVFLKLIDWTKIAGALFKVEIKKK